VVENGRVVSFVGRVHAVFHGDEAEKESGAKVALRTDSERIHTSAAEPTR